MRSVSGKQQPPPQLPTLLSLQLIMHTGAELTVVQSLQGLQHTLLQRCRCEQWLCA
eukprot:SAG31_NODE_2351_length_5889_cov_1.999482_6_plen_56_part_00